MGGPGRCSPAEQPWLPPHSLRPSSPPQQPPLNNIWHPGNLVSAIFYTFKEKLCFWNIYTLQVMYWWQWHSKSNVLRYIAPWSSNFALNVLGTFYNASCRQSSEKKKNHLSSFCLQPLYHEGLRAPKKQLKLKMSKATGYNQKNIIISTWPIF